MKRKYLFIVLTGIVVLGLFFRLWQLGNVPPSPDWDEAAIGYDAYSILKTGHDQFGKFLPFVLRSLDDYKPALYTYLAIPPIYFFGLNVLAVRLPSAIFGTLSIIAVFFLVLELFKSYKYKNALALISAFLFAISPWSIQFSRVGFESNVGTALNLFAVLFFIKGLRKPWFLIIFSVFAALSIYTYQSEKVFTSLLIFILIIIYRKELFNLSKKYIVLAFLLGFVLVLPMLFYIITDKSSLARVSKTSIFASQTDILKTSIMDLERDKITNSKLGLIFDNRRVVYAKTIVAGYLSHFDLNWLFIKGDNERHHAPNMGLLYLFELPFLLSGLYILAFGNFDKKTKALLFVWILLVPLPASITTGVPHAVRALNFLPIWQIIIALGIVFSTATISKMKYQITKIKIKYLIFAFCILFFLLNFSYYLNQYFVQLNKYDSEYWQYGYKQAVDIADSVGGNYKQIIVSSEGNFDKSYIFFLFYSKYPPLEYQKIVQQRPKDPVDNSSSFGKFVFRPIDWSKDSQLKNVLFIGGPDEFPQSAKVIKTIHYLNGTPAMKIVKT
jgi:4-amino-4-deoxy-L-arabinose transferase-like glycosyltransferase